MAEAQVKLGYILDPLFQIENTNGKPVVGGHIEVYEAGTNVKYITYQNFDFTQNPFKIPLGSDGRSVVLGDCDLSYDVYIYDSFNNLIVSRLNVAAGDAGGVAGGGLREVIHDETMTGKGTQLSPLGVSPLINLAVDETFTAYEATVQGKDSLVFGVNSEWFNDQLGSAFSGKVDLSAFNSAYSGLKGDISSKADLSALNNYFTKNETYNTFLPRSAIDVTNYYTKDEVYNKNEVDNLLVYKQEKLEFNYDENSAISAINGSALACSEGGSGDCPWLSGGKQIQETQLITPNMVIQVLSSFDLSGNKNHFIGVKGGTYRFPSSYELVDDIAQTYSFMPTSGMGEYLTTASFSSYSAITDTRITNVNEIANSGLSIATNNLYNKLDISSFNAWTAGSTATLTASGRTCLIGEDNVLVIAPGGVNDVILQGFGNSGTYEDFGQGYENSSFQYAFTQGRYNSANSEAFAQGYENSATKNALAQGSTNKSYYASLAQGIVNTALAYSLAQGYENSANSYSIAQGAGNTAFDNSISQGNGNFADHYSVAIGYDNNSYDFGFAFGGHLIASGLMALGTYNKVSSNASFVIGNGNYDDINQSAVYSDSFIIFKDGSLSAAGDISANGKKLTNSNCYCVKFTNELTSVNLSSYDSFDKVTVINPIKYGNDCLLNYNGNVKAIASGVWVELVNGLNNEWIFTNSGLMNRNWWE